MKHLCAYPRGKDAFHSVGNFSFRHPVHPKKRNPAGCNITVEIARTLPQCGTSHGSVAALLCRAKRFCGLWLCAAVGLGGLLPLVASIAHAQTCTGGDGSIGWF